MTDSQLYLAVGVPALLFATSLLVVIWQARGLEKIMLAKFERTDEKIESLTKIMLVKFERNDEKIESLSKLMEARFEAAQQSLLRVEQVIDARLSHLER